MRILQGGSTLTVSLTVKYPFIVVDDFPYKPLIIRMAVDQPSLALLEAPGLETWLDPENIPSLHYPYSQMVRKRDLVQ